VQLWIQMVNIGFWHILTTKQSHFKEPYRAVDNLTGQKFACLGELEVYHG
jgi:hypothetical protein